MSSRRDFLRKLSCVGLAGVNARWPSGSSIQASSELRSVPDSRFIALDRNENPYGPSAKVLDAIRRASVDVGRYPRETAKLIDRVAQVHKIDPAKVLLGAGSTEILRVACDAFLGKGRQLIQSSPTYTEMESYARSTGAAVISEPLTRNFEFDVDKMLTHRGSGLVYLCNPNNPTGTITPRKRLEFFLTRLPASHKILIDEAYQEFCPHTTNSSSFLDDSIDDDRIIVTRSFSLAYALAGLRLGFGVGSPKLVDQMRPFVTQNSINAVAVAGALAALNDADGLAETVRRNADARQEFANQCTSRSLKPLDSHTDFLAFNIYNPANLIIRYFRENNILIAPVSLSWDTYIRVSLGKPDEMRMFWEIWDKAPIDKSSIPH